MALRCGLVGLPGCGKTTIFNAITASGAASFKGTDTNRAIVNVPDPRLDKLAAMYTPRKVIPATLEMVDIPGLKPGSTAGEGRGNRLLGHIKDVDALVHVVRCFEDETMPFEYPTLDPKRDVDTIDLELVVADAQTLQNKIQRLERKAKAGDPEILKEVELCSRVKAALDEGVPARKQGLGPAETAAVRECNLLSIKPVLYVANLKSITEAEGPHARTLQALAEAEHSRAVMICGRDEAEINELDPGERPAFLKAIGLKESSIHRLIRAAYELLGMVNFFTVGEDEVHAWMCRRGDRAPIAAGKIHTDMEKGFVRMEVIRYEDLMEYGSEAAVARAGKHRLEGKTYEVQDGDIVVVRFTPPK